ncbi:Effector protein NopP [Bradyrhizobium sp. BR 1433]|uniref:Effector protein NopP n=1 Tax=Bradyrhizobium sp. BR 1433 TaxID=3447967 RepID=UPI003EE4F1B4
MYSRINDPFSQVSNAADTNDTSYSADGHGFAETLANMHLGSDASSSSSRSYSLVDQPPVVEISKRSFAKKAEAFYGDNIKHIADNPQVYSPRISSKAKLVKKVAKKYGNTKDTEHARYFSYQLGNTSVGLLRTEGGCKMSDEFEGDQWQKAFPGRTEVTSTVDLQIAHPLVVNAGDILLEYQLQLDGDRALLRTRPANDEARARSRELGFVEVDDDNMVLDPTQHPDKWTKNYDGKWQRADKPTRYLSKAESSDSENETGHVLSRSDDDYDFM